MPDEEYYLVSRSDMEDVADTIREAGGTSGTLEWKSGWISAIEDLSGGGAVVSWDTLADQNVTIASSSPNYFVITNFTSAFGADETYRITWGTGGTEFICQTFADNTGTSYDGYVIGNPGVVGGTDDGSGATFLIYRDSATRLVCATTTAAGTLHLKMEKQVISYGGNYQAKTNIDPTTSSQTITADSGYDALSSVQINAMPTGTAGTPTATKGTVSNHSISVTPSVTNTTGYITGSTKTGTAVTVSASELVSGSETKTANGTYDVTNLASLIVNVSGGVSNCVTGTFKGTTTGAAIDVTLDYTGTGYPVAVVIYPAEGPYNSGTGTFYGSTQRYASQMYIVLKSEATTAPSYESTGSKNYGTIMNRFKNSTSNSTSYNAAAASGANTFRDTAATSGQTSIVKIKSSKKMSVFIASSSYGFMANIDYKYWVLYSS